MSMQAITYTPIGVVHSPFTTLAGMPIQTVAATGVAATVELDPSYAAGLTDIDGFSYLLLITHLQKENGFDVNVIFYKGGAPTVQDLLAGVTDMALTTLAPLDPHFRAGKLRALATTGETRTPMLPDTPTLREQGVKGYPTYSWWGIYAPAGTPRPIVERMNGEIAKALRSPEVAPKLAAQIGMEILATSPEAFADFQKLEQERWTRIVTDNGIKAE